jgi:hypothetical protein
LTQYDPAPERKGVIAVRERREPEGDLMSGLTSLAKLIDAQTMA